MNLWRAMLGVIRRRRAPTPTPALRPPDPDELFRRMGDTDYAWCDRDEPFTK
jgi:hypothetical protein